MKKYLIVLTMLICASNTTLAAEIIQFETDLCTMFIDGTKQDPTKWAHCCVKHDLNYWVGGSAHDMDQADLDLKSCVTKADTEFMGKLMYFGVRAGKKSPFKLKGKTWGNAWVKARGLVALKKSDVLEVKEELENYKEISMEETEEFITYLNKRTQE